MRAAAEAVEQRWPKMLCLLFSVGCLVVVINVYALLTKCLDGSIHFQTCPYTIVGKDSLGLWLEIIVTDRAG